MSGREPEPVSQLSTTQPLLFIRTACSGAEARMSVAVSLLSLLITWALLLVLSRAGTGSAAAVPAAAPTPVPGKE